MVASACPPGLFCDSFAQEHVTLADTVCTRDSLCLPLLYMHAVPVILGISVTHESLGYGMQGYYTRFNFDQHKCPAGRCG